VRALHPCSFGKSACKRRESSEHQATAPVDSANKHASLGVKPADYGVVGVHLIQALRDVLQIDDEQAAAWREAYDFLAEILVKAERKLYAQAEEQDGGWAGYRTFVVDKKL
jgi:nitric oxide dioxygenase